MSNDDQDAEKNLFRDTVRHVKPLHPRNIRPTAHIPSTSTSDIPKTPKPIPTSTPIKTDLSRLKKINLPNDNIPVEHKTLSHVTSDERIAHRGSGIQHRLWQQLQKGKLTIDATLDLHGCNRSEAHHLWQDFLNEAQIHAWRVVLIIHGKSHRSSDYPILKNKVFTWLHEEKMALAFCSAQPQHGGTGALYVLLKIIKN
jgi:DNA-nicking Smr family endonuclease